MLELLQIGQHGFTIVGVVYVLYRIISSTSTHSTAEEYPPVQPPRRPPPPPPPSHLMLTYTVDFEEFNKTLRRAKELSESLGREMIRSLPPKNIELALEILAHRAIERGMPQRRVKALIKALRHGGKKG